VRNVGKRSGMHKHRRAFQCLHQGRLDGVTHQHRQRACHTQVVRGDGFAGFADADHDPAKAFAHVRQRGGQRQDRHNFTGNGDVKTGGAFMPGLFRTGAHRHAAQEAVGGVQHALPGDGFRVNIQPAQSFALLGRQVVRVGLGDAQFLQPTHHPAREVTYALLVGGQQAVEHLLIGGFGFVQHAHINRRRQQVVGSRDGVDVAGQVQVEVFHRDHLRVAAAGCPALDAKGGTLRRLADAGDGAVAAVRPQRLRQAHRGGRLALAQRCGGDGGHVDILAVRRICQALQYFQFHLGFERTVEFHFVGQQPQFLRHFGNWLDVGCLGDLNIRGDGGNAFEVDGFESHIQLLGRICNRLIMDEISMKCKQKQFLNC